MEAIRARWGILGSFKLAESLMKYDVEVDESLPGPAQEAIWRRRWMSYQRQLEKLKHRISGPAYRQFAFGIREKSLHDARLLSFQAGDAFGFVPDGTKEFCGRRKRGYAEIKLSRPR